MVERTKKAGNHVSGPPILPLICENHTPIAQCKKVKRAVQSRVEGQSSFANVGHAFPLKINIQNSRDPFLSHDDLPGSWHMSEITGLVGMVIIHSMYKDCRDRTGAAFLPGLRSWWPVANYRGWHKLITVHPNVQKIRSKSQESRAQEPVFVVGITQNHQRNKIKDESPSPLKDPTRCKGMCRNRGLRNRWCSLYLPFGLSLTRVPSRKDMSINTKSLALCPKPLTRVLNKRQPSSPEPPETLHCKHRSRNQDLLNLTGLTCTLIAPKILRPETQSLCQRQPIPPKGHLKPHA